MLPAWLRTLLQPRGEPLDESAVLEETWLHNPQTGESVRRKREKILAAHVNAAIHPLFSKNLVLMMPGWNGTVDGYRKKYRTIANFIRNRRIGAVVRTGNHPASCLPYSAAGAQQLRAVLRRIEKEAPRICGNKKPPIFLMGVSAGASTMAAVAHEFEKVTRLLLVAPSTDAGYSAIKKKAWRPSEEMSSSLPEQTTGS